VLLCDDNTIGASDVVLGQSDRTQRTDDDGFILPPKGIDLRELENSLIRQALARTNNNQTRAAKLLHLSRDAFRYRLEKLGLL
jgi:DNA-binding NtrC family response regulator